MATMDCRTIQVYRLPVYQKRTIDIDNHVSSPRARPSSFNRTSLASGRRHSTPPAPALRIFSTHSPPPNTFIKYYCPPTRPAGINKEQNPLSDPIKSPPRPTSLVRLRCQEDRNVRMVTTPTSLNSVTDIILPIAKKNRNTIVDTPTSVASDSQSTNRHVSAAKRGKAIALDFERDIFLSDDHSGRRSSRNESGKQKSIRWYHGKCPCRFSRCHCCHWYCSCPFCCWIICILCGLALFIAIIISMRFLSY